MGRSNASAPSSLESLREMMWGQEEFLLPLFMQDKSQFNLDAAIRESGRSRAGFLQEQQFQESLDLTGQFGSQFVQEQARLRDEAISLDPIAQASRAATLESIERRRGLSNQLLDQAEGGIADLDEDGLPDDIQRSILESSRSSLAARGLSESGAGGVLESLSLIGGREGLRNQRLSQANAILAGAAPASTPGLALASPSSPGILSTGSQFFPTGQLGQLAAGQANMQGQFGLFNAQADNQNMAALGGGLGSILGGAAFGFAAGGPLGALGGAGLGLLGT